MGGGLELFEANQQIEQISEDLNEVKYFIDFPQTSNLALIDISKLYDDLSHDISKYLTSKGIKNSNIGPIGGGGGGGGFLTLWEIVKALLETKSLITFFFSVVSYVKIAITKTSINDVKNIVPRVTLYLSIETKSKIDKIGEKQLEEIFSRRMINLLLAVICLVNYLNRDNEHLYFDFSVSGVIAPRDYTISFSIPHEQRKKIEPSRFLKIINKIKIRKSLWSSYKMTNWFAVSRSDTTYSTNKSSAKTKPTYYLFISTRVISDYF